MIHFVVQQKLTQHCKSNYTPIKNKLNICACVCVCVCVCVYTGGKKKNKRTGVEKRWERKANSLLIPGTGSSRHPKGRMLSYVPETTQCISGSDWGSESCAF